MHTVLLVGPFLGDCEFAPSPAKRLEGYVRHLQKHGWRVVAVVPACRCAVAQPPPGQLVLRADELARAAASWRSDDPLILRPILEPSRSFRTWLSLARRTGREDVIRSKMAWHWLPELTPVPPIEPAGEGHLLARIARDAVGTYVRAFGQQRARARALRRIAKQLVDAGVTIDVAFGSHPYGAELAGAAEAARRGGGALVVELRDAVRRGWRPLYEAIEMARVRRTVRSAAAVVHVTPQEQARDRTWLRRDQRMSVIEHGFDPDEWRDVSAHAVVDRDVFRVRFLGSLYGDLHLRAFLEGFVMMLAALPSEQRSRICFEYYGRSTEMMRSHVGETVPSDMAGRVTVHDVVPRRRALELMASAGVLILPMEVGVPGGRFYEYLGSHRPILAVGQREDPYVSDILRRSGIGMVAVGPSDVAAALTQRFEGWLAGAHEAPADEAVLDHFSRARQAAELAELLELAMEER